MCSQFQAEFSQLVENTLHEAWQDFQQLSAQVKEDAQTFICKELIASMTSIALGAAKVAIAMTKAHSGK